MRQKAEQAEFRKRLAASSRIHRKVMKELVNFAHSAKNNSENANADITFDAYGSRLSAHEKLIQERGGFQPQEANLVLVNHLWETKERCALWLRTELKL